MLAHHPCTCLLTQCHGHEISGTWDDSKGSTPVPGERSSLGPGTVKAVLTRIDGADAEQRLLEGGGQVIGRNVGHGLPRELPAVQHERREQRGLVAVAVCAVQQAIVAASPRALHTFHCNPFIKLKSGYIPHSCQSYHMNH